MLTIIEKWIGSIIVLGLYLSCYGQAVWPKERGLIMTTYDKYSFIWRGNVQMCHLPIYPGYESYSDTVPGINFTNPRIHFVSVDVDYRTRCVYMYDKYLRSIVIGTGYNAALDSKNMTFKRMHGGVSIGTVQVAVDWLSHTVYWSDSLYRWIIAAPGQADKIEYDYYKIIADTHLEAPDGIAVDPLEGYLFWSDNGKHPKIERSDLKGENRHTIVSKHLKSPISIETDVIDKRIYWIDESSILSATYVGRDIISVRRIPESSLFDLATFREVVYVSDIRQQSIYTLKKTKGPELGRQQSSTIQLPSQVVYGLAVYGAETQPLKDNDYCAEKSCEHMCISTRNGSQCVCSEGYDLNEESGKCNETSASFHRAIVVANATHVCLVDIRAFAYMNYEYVCRFTTLKKKQARSQDSSLVSTTTEQTKSVTHGTTTRVEYIMPHAESLHNITRIAMDMENRVLFFATAENVIYKRPIDLPIENDAVDSLVEATGNISGLAYDAGDSNNVYWCEFDTGSIWVVNVGTKAAKNITVGDGGLSKPRNIAVILKHRVLAVVTENDRYESIVTVTMEGDDKTVVVQASSGISSFAFDSEQDKFYYISGRSLYSTMNNGSSPQIMLYSVDANAYNLIKYQHYLTWVYQYPRGNGDFYLRVYGADDMRQVTQGMFNYTSISIVDMQVLDVKLQSSNVTNPCAVDNGGCSQICITKYVSDTMTPICECRFGYLLSEDGYTCSTAAFVEDNFLIAVDLTNNELLQVNLETDETTVFPDMENGYYKGVYFDPQTKRVHWTELYDRNIYSANLNGTDRRTDFDYPGYAYRFDKDLTTRNFYFIQWLGIGVVFPHGEVLELKRIDSRRDLGDIVVHPEKGWLYFTATGYRSKYVGRLDMDGENFMELITGDHVDKPLGLAIDFIKDRLYWSDATFDTIQRCNLNGEDCITILNMTGTYLQEEIRDLETDGDFLYYSAFRLDHIVRVELKEPYTRKVLGQTLGIGKLDIMTFYSSKSRNVQPESKACSGRNGLGDCSTICLPNPKGRTCACENDIPLKEDGRTCVNIFQCTDIIEQIVVLSPGKKQVVDITFSRSCLRNLNEKCHYKCPKHFQPLYDTLLTCTNVGWTLESETLCREVRCPEKIENGYIDSSSCEREVGETCNYSCNDGFEKTTDNAVCVENGTYHIPGDGLCAPFKCSALVENGKLDENCTRELGNTCNYSCNKYYSKTSGSLQITCQGDGWSLNTNKLCKESMCKDNSLTNGMVTADCQKKVGNVCTIICEKGYLNTTTYAVCKDDLIWHPIDACKPVRCPPVLSNGQISGTCKFAVGSTCNFTCDVGYKENSPHRNVTCNLSGQWNLSPCTEVSCLPTIKNGKLSPECDRTIGKKCGFVCNEGFLPTTESVICTENGTYHVPEEELCRPFTCTSKIGNGALANGCSRTIGSACNFTCNKYFTPSVSNTEISCQSDGWNPTSTDLCKVSVCEDITLPNGKVTDDCQKKIGEPCRFRCNQGYVNTTYEVICRDDSAWHPRDSCTASTCTNKIDNGALADGCTRTIGSTCNFTCNKYFTPSVSNNELLCQADGWNPTSTDLCKVSVCENISLSNGKVNDDCQKKIGEPCRFRCNQGYVNTTYEVICRDGSWYPRNSCTEFKCTDKVENGVLAADCTGSIGSVCNFSCNSYFTPKTTNTFVTCQEDGWSPPSSELCKVSVCSESSLRNSKIVDNCLKRVGETCMFKCNPGYTNTTDVAICTSDGTWHPREPCSAIKCSSLIPNGEISGECDHGVGAICSFRCLDGFMRNGVQQKITCKSNGQWDLTSDLCLESSCEDTSLYDGKVVGNCLKRAGDVCEFQCNNNFTNTTGTIVCKSDNKWHPVDACIQDSCQPFIPNGNFTGLCDYKIGSSCSFTCNEGFSAVDQRTSIRCNMAGHWDIPGQLCYAQTGVSERVQNNAYSVAGVASGIAVLCIVIVALAVALVFVFRRKTSGRIMNRLSGPRGGGTAIENPGYLQYNDPSYHVKEEEPSTSDDSTQMQTIFSEEASPADDRIMDQVNNIEPLPDKAELELGDDRVFLTRDSWLKEREKKD